MEKLDCPHLMRDFVTYPQQGSSTELISPLSKVDGVSNEVEYQSLNLSYVVGWINVEKSVAPQNARLSPIAFYNLL